MAESLRTQDFSHLPQPVQYSAWTTGSKMACFAVRALCEVSSVIALSIAGQTR